MSSLIQSVAPPTSKFGVPGGWHARVAGIAVVLGLVPAAALLAISPGSRGLPTAAVLVAVAALGWVAVRSLAPANKPDASYSVRPSVRGWSRDPQSPGRQRILKAAFDALGGGDSLARSELLLLPVISRGPNATAELRTLLIDVVAELASSGVARDSEAGRLLLDYYIRRVGTHEVVMERLCLSRPTFYRRLHRGFQLVAERLDELSDFATALDRETR